MDEGVAVDRRRVLQDGLTLLGAGAVAACGGPSGSESRPHGPASTQARAAGTPRQRGRIHTYQLTAQPGPVDLGGVQVSTWSYGGTLPGPEIRVTTGDVIQARLVNHLPAQTTIHWHGVPVPNGMDGVPGITQAAVSPGGMFAYQFTAAVPGTYWFHPHAGMQLDRGLYAPLIVEDPAEPAGYDHDWVVVLDDWIDGTGYTPDQVLTLLRRGMGGMGGMGGKSPLLRGAMSALLGGDAGDVRYPYYLANGRIPAAPQVFTAKPRQKARIRLINAAADTAFRVALGGHRMRLTHTDGYPVIPADTDALLIGMGERYDVQVTLGDGIFPLAALAEGKNATALALIRTSAGSPPPAGVRPAELNGELARYDRLHPTPADTLPARAPDVTHRLDLTGSMMSYDWGINGHPFDPSRQVTVREGQRARITFRNRTMMYHPMHLHGHTFQINTTGARKDTVIVLPGQTVTCDLDADNPGRWAAHCHNIYHAEAGMMTILGYQA